MKLINTKKLLLLLPTITAALCLAFGLSACNSTESKHIHTYGTDNVCTECGYKLNYTEGLVYCEYYDTGTYAFCGGVTDDSTDITIAAYYNELPVKYVVLGSREYLEQMYMAQSTQGTVSSEQLDALFSYYSDSITSIIIPDGVTFVTIEAYSAIKNVTLSETISSLAVSDCENLEEIDIPTSVTYLSIDECPKLTTETENGITYYKNCVISCDENLTKAEIREGTTAIDCRAFIYNENITEVIIPSSMTNISEYAFSNCTALESVTISNGVKTICDYAFWNCTSLTSVVIPDSVTTLQGAFGYCTSLTSVVIPDSVTAIQGAFWFCSSLTNITIPQSVTLIDYRSFTGCYRLVEIYNLSSLDIAVGSEENGEVAYYAINVYTATSGESRLFTQGDYLFIYDDDNNYYLVNYTGTETEITLPELMVNGKKTNYEIKSFAFYYDDNIIDVIIPDSVTSIGEWAFGSCASLTNIVIGDSVTFIGDYALNYCTALISITIPDSVTSIGELAFYWCTALKSVVISDSVTSIGNYAFSGCNSLTSVYYTGTASEWNAITFENSYANPIDYGATIYYYAESGTTTEAGNYWYYDADGSIKTWSVE